MGRRHWARSLGLRIVDSRRCSRQSLAQTHTIGCVTTRDRTLRCLGCFTQYQTSHLKELREAVFSELKGRLQETDETGRFRSGPYLYFARTMEGQSYPIHCRCRAAPGSQSAAGSAGLCASGAAVEVLLDENDEAAGLPLGSQMSVHAVVASPGHRFVAFSIDTTGYETFDLHIKELGSLAPAAAERLEGTDGTIVWSADEHSIFYLQFDEQHRPAELWQHTLGTAQSADILLYTEQDQLFGLSIRLSVSRFLSVCVCCTASLLRAA
jgi:oligopeptidase B